MPRDAILTRPALAAAVLAVLAAAARAEIRITPQDLAGKDGQVDAVDAETNSYRIRFGLRGAG